MMRDRNHDESMAELIKEDPAYALDLLNSISKTGNRANFLSFCAR